MPQSNQQDSKPSAPQAESVPSGKQPFEIYDEFLQQYSDSVATNCQPPDVLLVWMEKWAIYYAASQTAALAAERDSLREQMKSLVTQLATHHDLKHDALDKLEAAERSNSLLRERLNAAIRLFGEIETIDQPYLVFERDFWKRITDFAAQKENQ